MKSNKGHTYRINQTFSRVSDRKASELGKMMNKKGIELPLSAIVTVILMVMILAGAIVLTFRFFAGAEEIRAEIDRSTREQISSLLRTGNSLVAIPFNKAQLSRGGQKVFVVGVRNIAEKARFSVRVEFDSAYDLNEKPIVGVLPDFINDKWLGAFSTILGVQIDKNKIDFIPVVVKAQGAVSESTPAPRGVYVFNVCVYKDAVLPLAPCQLEQLEMTKEVFYDKTVHQLFVEL
ncbi:MAG: hypothetical protein HY363_02885 [Candidatus Aenigmarchaeota archaeon]|nr:hypothetical protein [Candidatus Aenigmarchaeota archaeon]